MGPDAMWGGVEHHSAVTFLNYTIYLCREHHSAVTFFNYRIYLCREHHSAATSFQLYILLIMRASLLGLNHFSVLKTKDVHNVLLFSHNRKRALITCKLVKGS